MKFFTGIKRVTNLEQRIGKTVTNFLTHSRPNGIIQTRDDGASIYNLGVEVSTEKMTRQ